MLGAGSPEAGAARETGARIERLLDEFRSAARPEVADRAEELVALLVELYGAGLQRIAGIFAEEPGGEAVLRRLAADDLVASLLVLHDVHPDDTETRVLAALDQVRPYLGSHAGDVEYLGVDADPEHGAVVRLRLQGSCEGCPSSLVTVKTAIEKAIEEAAPEVARVEVDGVTQPRPARSGAQFLDLAPPPPRLDGEWTPLDRPLRLGDGQSVAIELNGTAVAMCRLDGRLYAYLDRCPRCGSGVGGSGVGGSGVVDGLLGCPGCGERYDVRLAGRGGEDGLHLDPLPLLGDGADVRIAVPSGAVR
jgi:Fe-S cluster biogenesis protein NfuA/nitrite reductase/ring-hydroxylating ferredoxin subunit